MKMDIACPVELLCFEQASFGEGRRQAYLTFLNESPQPVTAVSGRLYLLDAQRQPIEDRHVSFASFVAGAGAQFACTMALDDYPAFEDAEMVIERVTLDGEAPWTLNPARAKAYDPPVQPVGVSRNALIAIAGHDAVCFPRQEEGVWLCVCGRYNRWRWTACRRCRRERDMVFARLMPEQVMAAYEKQLQDNRRQQQPRMIVPGRQGSPQGKPPPPQPKKAPPPVPDRAPPRQKSAKAKGNWRAQLLSKQRTLTFAVCVVVVIMLAWGIVSIAGRLTRQSPGASQTPLTVDYLPPI